MPVPSESRSLAMAFCEIMPRSPTIIIRSMPKVDAVVIDRIPPEDAFAPPQPAYEFDQRSAW